MIIRGRTNTAAANTRAIRKTLAGRVLNVTVKSFDYCSGGGEVVSTEIESLMSARKILMDAGFTVTNIKTYSALDPRFYAERKVSE